MIIWVDELCRVWGVSMARIAYGTPRQPSRAALATLVEAGFTGALEWQRVWAQPRRLSGEARRVADAVRSLSEQDRNVLFAHYVVGLPAKTKAAEMGISRRTYYSHLQRANRALCAALGGRR